MLFKIAMHGSFKTTAGYTWLNPNNLNIRQLEIIGNLLSDQPSDGRSIQDNEIRGGFYVDKSDGCFYAFRFLNGGKDALGREGVVITNWAVAPVSEVCGKNIRSLFDSLSFKEFPDSNEVNLPVSFEFGLASPLQEGVLIGDEVDSVFRLPEKIDQNTLVQFALKNVGKKATVKYLRPSKPESPSNPIKTTFFERTRPRAKKTNGLQWNKTSFQHFVLSLLAVCIFLLLINSILSRKDIRKNDGNTPLSQRNEPGVNSQDPSRGNLVNDRTPREEESLIDSVVVYVLAGDYSWYNDNDGLIGHYGGRHSYKRGDISFRFSAQKKGPALSFSHPKSVSHRGDRIYLFPSFNSEKDPFRLTIKKVTNVTSSPDLSGDLDDFYILRKDITHEPEICLLIFPDSIELECASDVQIITLRSETSALPQFEDPSSSVPVIVIGYYKSQAIKRTGSSDDSNSGSTRRSIK